MPTLKKQRPKFRPDENVICVVPFAGQNESVNAGDQLRGDDPRVIANESWFSSVETPTAERSNVWQTMPEPPRHRPEPPLPDTRVMVRAVGNMFIDAGFAPGSAGAKSGRVASGFGRAVRAGELVPMNDPVVKAAPQNFETLPRPLTPADFEEVT